MVWEEKNPGDWIYKRRGRGLSEGVSEVQDQPKMCFPEQKKS